MGLRMSSIHAKNGSAIIGEEKAGEGALGVLLERRVVRLLDDR